ncbi:MAG: hypothetical protein U1E74_00190 [Paenacidovorax caeni]
MPALLLRDDLLDARERRTLLALVAPGVKNGHGQRDHQEQAHGADQVQPGHGGFIGGKMHPESFEMLWMNFTGRCKPRPGSGVRQMPWRTLAQRAAGAGGKHRTVSF